VMDVGTVIEEVEAFLDGREAHREGLRSTGRELWRGPTLVARWNRGAVEVLSPVRGESPQVRKDRVVLVRAIALAMRRRQHGHHTGDGH